MDISYHVAFHKDNSPKLLSYLKQHQIPHEHGEIVVSLDILESDSHWRFIEECVKTDDLVSSPSKVFTKEELLSAERLLMFCYWRFDYPQPEDTYCDGITYISCHECQEKLKQVAPFRMKKAPKMGKRGFLTMNWVDDELFVSENTKALLEQERFSDISFCEVQNKSGTEAIPEVYQLIVDQYLPANPIKESVYAPGFSVCPACGGKKYRPNLKEKYIFRKEIFENAPDIVRTEERFGYNSARQQVIVNQRFYRTITKYHLDRSLGFEPIDLM